MITTTRTDRTLTVLCYGDIDQEQWLAKVAEHGLQNQMFEYVDYAVELDADGAEVHYWRMHFALDDTTAQAS